MKKIILSILYFGCMNASADIGIHHKVKVEGMELGAPISGATVIYKYTDPRTGATGTAQCTTDSSGTCKYSFRVTYGFWDKSDYEVGTAELLLDGQPVKHKQYKEVKLNEAKWLFKVTTKEDLNGVLERFRNNIQVKDDEFESVATFNTSGIRAGNSTDSVTFLRAFVDKKGLSETYQVYSTISYRDFAFRSINLAKYLTAAGPKGLDVRLLTKDVNCASKDNFQGQCLFQEVVVFDIDTDLVSRISEDFNAKGDEPWKFRLSSRAGKDFDLTISNMEFFAINERVIKYKSIKK